MVATDTLTDSGGSLIPLLSTKLNLPRVFGPLIRRSELIDRLNDGIHRKLILVSAPSGSGKTSLIAQWSQQTELTTTWFSLDKSDNDPIRFWRYFIGAIQKVDPDAGITTLDVLDSPHPIANQIVLTNLINDVCRVGRDFAVILDDYHFLTNDAIHRDLGFLLDHMPPQMHLVILTRTNLPFSVAHFRVRGQLTELYADQLRFDFYEAAAFLRKVMGLELSVEDVHTLETRTEGWIAGLQLAALSIQGRRDVSNFISQFRGNHEYVLDYLTGEVLNQHPGSVQKFLLQTSMLEKLTADLCRAVTGLDRSQDMLQYLEQSNLFLVSLDHERRWYRYHHLFADLLRARLQQMYPETVKQLHHKAGVWYERNGFTIEAVDHALAGEDFAGAVKLVDKSVRRMFSYGEFASLLSWLEQLPNQMVRTYPRLQVSYAWGLVAIARLDDGERELDEAEKTLMKVRDKQRSISHRERTKLLGQIAAIRAYAARIRGDVPLAIVLSKQALEQSRTGSHLLQSLVAFNLGIAHIENRDLSAARIAFAEASQSNRSAGHIYITISLLNGLGDIERLRGHLSEAQRMYDQASQVASEWSVRINRSLPISGGSYNALGSLFYEWNDLDQASNHFRQGIILGKRGGIVEILTAGYVGLARIECARNDIDSALDLIEKAHELIRFVTGSLHIAELMAFKATLWMMKGKPEVARFWLDESDRLTDGRFSLCQPEFHGSVLARLLMAQGRFDKAVAILENVFPILNRAGYIDKEIELLIVMAQALGALGERYQALSKLERALTLARPGNYIRSFIDGGHFIAELLYELAAHNVELDYVEQILSAFNDQPGSGAFIANLDALSSRETEVLQLLNEGLSNQKIADKLIIASSTVKVHTRSIYSKLNVNNRQQAVARALALKIL